MAYGYWRLKMAERESVFHLFFRRHPFQGEYTLSCGLESVIDYLRQWHFTKDELSYLSALKDVNKQPLFSKGFLDYLRQLRFTCDVSALSEGQLVFPHEPLLRIQGPLLQCQLLETALVNRMSFASLIATKASRICRAAQGDSVIEFGLRRAQGPDGGMTASRSAYVGGCDSVSNTLAAMVGHIPPTGTMAHSWVMAFDHELESFEKFSQTMSGNVILLVDTYDTMQGVQNAIKVGKQLRESGHDLLGIRLDSGDLLILSQQARQQLDTAGFTQTKIVASGDLDEHIIAKLKKQNAPIDIWGVGTRMTTCWDQPALDTAYKLSAIQDAQGAWQYRVKRSNTPGKTTNPGIQQVRRYSCDHHWLGDVIYDERLSINQSVFSESDHEVDLLQPIFQQGELVYAIPSLTEVQKFCRQQLDYFFNRSDLDKPYSVILDPQLTAVKEDLLSNYSEMS